MIGPLTYRSWLLLLATCIVVFGVNLFDRLRIDDPVGALSVHLLGGIWGTLAVGLFAQAAYSSDVGNGLLYGGGLGLFGVQILGILVVGIFVAVVSTGLWMGIRATIGLRVNEEEEELGLDLSEMRMRAYPAEDAGVRVLAPQPDLITEAAKALVTEEREAEIEADFS